MTYTCLDIRQSPNWGTYLEQWNWETYETKTGIILRTTETNNQLVGKIQRPQELNQEDIDAINEITKDYLFVKLEPNINQDLNLLKENGFLISKNPLTPTKTITIDLTKNLGDLYKNISRSGKYSINRAKRENYVAYLAERNNSEEIEEFAQIHAESSKAKGSKKFSVDEIKHMIESFGEKAHIIFSRDENGVVCASNLYLGFGDCVWYMLGGTTNLGRNTKGGYLLYWESFKILKELGYKTLDLDGIEDERVPDTKSWRGFSNFKKKFGGTEYEFPRPYIIYNGKKWLKYLHPLLSF